MIGFVVPKLCLKFPRVAFINRQLPNFRSSDTRNVIWIKSSPDSVVAIIQRAGRRQNVVSADNPRAVVRVVPPGDVSLQIRGFSRRVDAPIPMMRMMMVVVMMVMQMVTVTVVGRPRDRFVGVRHRIRHEGHHLIRDSSSKKACDVFGPVTVLDHLRQPSRHTDPSTCSPSNSSRTRLTEEGAKSRVV